MENLSSNRLFAILGEKLMYRVWSTPKWTHYLLAIVTTLATAQIRMALHPVLQGRIQFIYFTIPIALSALIGGFWPGLVATAISFTVGTFLIAPTAQRFSSDPIPSAAAQAQISISFAFIWLFICCICDIMRCTAMNLKSTSQERDESREGLLELLNRISDGFVAIDSSGRVVYENEALQKLFSLPAEQAVGYSLEEIQTGQPNAGITAIQQVIKANDDVGADFFIESKDQWYHIRAYPDRAGTSIFVQDISARKKNEQAQERLIAQERWLRSDAEQANRLKDEFVATTSHELRTPLSTILGWSEILQRRNMQSNLTEGLAAIERSTRIQVQLINDLLDMSRLATGRMKLDFAIVEVVTIINEVIRLHQPSASNKGIELEEVQSDDEFFIQADSERLAQVFTNLISNAVKFTLSGGRIMVHLEPKSDAHLAITVSDTGEGIEHKYLSSIFMRFRQGNSSPSRKHGGLGLGLAIVKELVESHGGRIEASSQGIGEGSAFTVYLPLKSIPPPPEQMEEESHLLNETLSDLYILVVEDDEGTQAVLEMLLSETGARVTVVGSAAAALELLGTEQPDVLVSDIGMPEMDGFQLIRKIRSTFDRPPMSRIRALALTAFASEVDRQKAFDAGFDGFLAKPIDGARLRSAIRELASPM